MKWIALLTVSFAAVPMRAHAEAPAAAPAAASGPAKNVVLVHGAWADGSSWSEVIPLLQKAGLNVVAVQNPLTSVADDVAATKRVLATLEGPTVLAGHSYAGSVVSDAGVDSKVTALVYVAARAPDAGEDFVALAAKYPTMPVRAGAHEHDGFVWLDQEHFLKYFAGDVPKAKALALFAVQQPVSATLFAGKTFNAAWHDKPSFYAVSKKDETTSPELERFLAKRMNATTIELDSSHVSLISHPKEIADLILKAAGLKK